MDKKQIYEELKSKLNEEFIKIDEPMSKHTSFKIGGNADIFVTIKNEQDLEFILNIAKNKNIPLTIIGNGTNLLVKDNGIRGITLKIELNKVEIEKNEQYAIITASAGVKNAVLAQKLLQEQIAGFEFAAGIPGTIGGAIYMNAGAYGGEMKQIVQEVTYIDKNAKSYTFTNEECEFDYRHSIFCEKDFIITKVKMKLPYGKKEQIKQKMDDNTKSRKEKQPIQMPSAGSTFKRGKDFLTAKLIDECGLKGYKIGDAQVSSIHAGFIVNSGNAKAKDIICLIEHVQKTVFEKFGKKIELEIKIIGE